MAFAKVIEMFERPKSVKAAMRALLETRVATGATLRVEPEYLIEELHPLDSHKHLRDWLKEWFESTSDEDFTRYRQVCPVGRLLLVATVLEAKADNAMQIMSRHGGILYIPGKPHDHHLNIRGNALFDRSRVATERFGRAGMGAAH